MHNHGTSAVDLSHADDNTTLLIGNPNVGKSVIFGILTGRYANVSNYPGTTVEIAQSRRRTGDGVVVDLPGINSLLPNSQDEQVTRDVLINRLGRGKVVQVCDAKNLARGLFIALQLAELQVPMLFVANMFDEARARGYALDRRGLEQALGVAVLETVATQQQGVAGLVADELEFRPCLAHVRYDRPIEEAVGEVQALLPPQGAGQRGLALMLLAEDGLPPWAGALLDGRRSDLERIRARLVQRLTEPVRLSITRARQSAAMRLAGRVLRRGDAPGGGWSAWLGDWAMHPLWGIPMAAAVLYLIYLFVGVLGAGTAVDFLEHTVFQNRLVPWLDAGLRALLPAFLEAFLVGPPGAAAGRGPGLLIGDYGLVSMGLSYAFAIVLPIVGFFFIAFSLLEDSGYMPRLAVMLNRAFKLLGLNGKAVLPMLLGLGCDTMATMTARILPTVKERVIVTLLLALGVPCSAQLGVILGMMANLSLTAMLWWAGTVVATMMLVGYLANRLLPGQASEFILEIPPMRRPALTNIAIKTLARVEWYLKEVVPLFVLGTLILWLLERVHALGAIERLLAPLVQGFLGLPAKATEAFLIGFLRRDYGAAGLFDLFRPRLAGGHPDAITEIQIVVSLVTITLFVPCIANFFMIVKERGMRTALWMAGFIFPFAILVGGLLNLLLRGLWL